MGDSYPTELPEARQLLASCNDCAALAADVRLIAASMQRLPQPRRPRDFRLTPEQAQRAHGSAVERFFRALGGTGWATLRPVAGVAMSIGLVLAVVGATMPGYLAPASAPSQESRTGGQAPAVGDVNAAPSAPPPTLPSTREDHATPGPEATAFGTDVGMSSSSQPPAQGPTTQTPDDTDVQTPSEVAPVAVAETEDPTTGKLNNAYTERSPDAGRDGSEALPAAATTAPTGPLLIFAGIAIAALSLGLLTLAWLARRRFSDPLLR